MATIINNPSESSGGGILGLLIVVIAVIVLGVLFFVYGLPYVSDVFQNNKNVIPSQVDININTTSAPNNTTAPTSTTP